MRIFLGLRGVLSWGAVIETEAFARPFSMAPADDARYADEPEDVDFVAFLVNESEAQVSFDNDVLKALAERAAEQVCRAVDQVTEEARVFQRADGGATP